MMWWWPVGGTAMIGLVILLVRNCYRKGTTEVTAA